jgi:hypothetical protein
MLPADLYAAARFFARFFAAGRFPLAGALFLGFFSISLAAFLRPPALTLFFKSSAISMNQAEADAPFPDRPCHDSPATRVSKVRSRRSDNGPANFRRRRFPPGLRRPVTARSRWKKDHPGDVPFCRLADKSHARSVSHDASSERACSAYATRTRDAAA